MCCLESACGALARLLSMCCFEGKARPCESESGNLGSSESQARCKPDDSIGRIFFCSRPLCGLARSIPVLVISCRGDADGFLASSISATMMPMPAMPSASSSSSSSMKQEPPMPIALMPPVPSATSSSSSSMKVFPTKAMPKMAPPNLSTQPKPPMPSMATVSPLPITGDDVPILDWNVDKPHHSDSALNLQLVLTTRMRGKVFELSDLARKVDTKACTSITDQLVEILVENGSPY